MAKRRPNPKPDSSATKQNGVGQAARVPNPMHQHAPPGAGASGSPPSTQLRSLLTVCLVAHGFLLLVSYGAIVEPSDVQARLQRFFSWYLQPLHLQPNGRPVYLLHRGEETATVRFQVRALPTGPVDGASEEEGWQPLSARGWVGGEHRKRYQRWAATTAALAEQQQVGLVGLLARPVISDEDSQAFRIVALDNVVTRQLPYFEPERYRAAIVREGDQMRFVELNESRQNAVPRQTAGKTSESPGARAEAATSESSLRSDAGSPKTPEQGSDR